ncbi:LexA family protein [Motiliproteus sp.]|uniref:LexA family protein n=1 Tax=Motiliproteus sp. TaxID=1898955 RepID=UPI003BAA37BE
MKILNPLSPLSAQPLPLFSNRVSAGFPSPADDYLEASLDLNSHLIKHPAATFFVRAEGDSMIGRGIYPGDLLIVDRSIKPRHGLVVIAAIHGELTCKILDARQRCLMPANKRYPSIPITDECGFTVEGVVTASVRYQQC